MGFAAMPFKRWFSAGRSTVRDRVVKALQQARDGDPADAVETISEMFPQALAALQTMAAPADPAWLRLAAWLAYRAAEMGAALDFAARATELEEDAQTWHLVGRLRLWLKDEGAQAAFRQAAILAPDRYVVPFRVRRDRFMKLAEAALARIPDRFQEQLANTMIVVDDLPSLDAVREGEDPDLLGLYEGATVLEHGLPERIVLYQRNHENIAADALALEREVTETMRHEIGHHFGMAEDELPY